MRDMINTVLWWVVTRLLRHRVREPHVYGPVKTLKCGELKVDIFLDSNMAAQAFEAIETRSNSPLRSESYARSFLRGEMMFDQLDEIRNLPEIGSDQ